MRILVEVKKVDEKEWAVMAIAGFWSGRCSDRLLERDSSLYMHVIVNCLFRCSVTRAWHFYGGEP